MSKYKDYNKTVQEKLSLTAKAVIIIFILSIVINFILLITINSLTPTKRIEPYYVAMRSKADHIMKIERAVNTRKPDLSNKWERSFVEALIRKYVILRESIVPNNYDMDKKWGSNSDVFYMSSDRVIEDFTNWPIYTKGLNNPDDLVREVHINTIEFQPNRVEWDVNGYYIDRYPEGTSEIKKDFEITIKVDFDLSDIERKYKNRWKNPLGFKVIQYEHQEIPQYDYR
jgi:type IV secretory pathway component VirB8